MILECIFTCPECGHKKKEQMHENVCQTYYRCSHCHQQIKAKAGECCVFCSYADYPCPQAQIAGSSCCGRD